MRSASSRENPPLFSIVIPVYNGEKYIEECLRSVTENLSLLTPAERQEIELVISDNHSTDRTIALIEGTDLTCPVRLLRTPDHYDNRTLNWHYGLSSARGIWMMMLHADDLLAPKALPALLRACRQQRNSTAVLIAGRLQTFADLAHPNKAFPAFPLPTLISGQAMRRHVQPEKNCVAHFSAMRRTAYEAIGGLDARYQLVQDWNLWTRMLDCGDIYYMPVPVGLWRSHGYSEKFAKLYIKEHILFARDIPHLIPTLTTEEGERALVGQLAKAKAWQPDVTLEELFADVPDAAELLARPRLSKEQADALQAALDRRTGFHLNRLRLSGLWRLLFMRRSQGDSASAHRPRVSASALPPIEFRTNS